MDDGPERRWAQAALHLGEVADLTPAEAETDRRVGANVAVPRERPEDLDLQAERLHRLDRVGEEARLETLGIVHQRILSTQRGQMFPHTGASMRS
jgi:hypothetical protein